MIPRPPSVQSFAPSATLPEVKFPHLALGALALAAVALGALALAVVGFIATRAPHSRATRPTSVSAVRTHGA